MIYKITILYSSIVILSFLTVRAQQTNTIRDNIFNGQENIILNGSNNSVVKNTTDPPEVSFLKNRINDIEAEIERKLQGCSLPVTAKKETECKKRLYHLFTKRASLLKTLFVYQDRHRRLLADLFYMGIHEQDSTGIVQLLTD
jgi:hypothetical protein